MKTKFRTLIAVIALAFAGVYSANASENNSGLFISAENTTIDYLKEAQMINRWIVDMAEAKTGIDMMERNLLNPNETIFSIINTLETETNSIITDLTQEAQQITKLIADREEAKAIQNAMDRGFVAPNETVQLFENEAENNDVVSEFGKEAQIMTRIIADKEEAKTIQRLIAEGKLAGNE
jgi:hypothetical protein